MAISIAFWIQHITNWSRQQEEIDSMYIDLTNASAKHSSIWAEWRLRRSGRSPLEASETHWWGISSCPASIPHVALHSTLWSQFHHYFSFCQSPIWHQHSGVWAICDHTLGCIQWVGACIGIAMWWMTLRKSLIEFLLPAYMIQFSLYSLYTSFQFARSMWLLTMQCEFLLYSVILQVAISGITRMQPMIISRIENFQRNRYWCCLNLYTFRDQIQVTRDFRNCCKCQG